MFSPLAAWNRALLLALFPAGSYIVWSGQFEYMERAQARMKIVVPVMPLIAFLLHYLNPTATATDMLKFNSHIGHMPPKRASSC